MSIFTKLYRQTSQTKPPGEPAVPSRLPDVIRTEYAKSYPRFPRFLLPPTPRLDMPLGQALTERESVRTTAGKTPSLPTLSSLLFYAAGIKSLPNKEVSFSRRTYPSAGARYPLELYLYLKQPIGQLISGIYHYQVQQHALEKLPAAVNVRKLQDDVFGEMNGRWLANCWGVVFVSAVFQRTEIKYGDSAFRFVLLEAGHLMQNIYLAATGLGMGCCAIGGFSDANINKLLDLDVQKETVIYCAGMTG